MECLVCSQSEGDIELADISSDLDYITTIELLESMFLELGFKYKKKTNSFFFSEREVSVEVKPTFLLLTESLLVEGRRYGKIEIEFSYANKRQRSLSLGFLVGQDRKKELENVWVNINKTLQEIPKPHSVSARQIHPICI
jgi:hypothetical protein